MEEISIKGKEIEKLKAQFENIQEQKLKINNKYVVELQKSHRQTQRIEQLENESVMAQTLAQANENIWVKINEAITEIWPSIEIFFQQEELVQISKEILEKVKDSLGQIPGEANTLIKVLNSKTKDELEEFEILYKT